MANDQNVVMCEPIITYPVYCHVADFTLISFFEKIWPMCRSTGLTIAGSFAMQLVLDRHFSNADIDLWMELGIKDGISVEFAAAAILNLGYHNIPRSFASADLQSVVSYSRMRNSIATILCFKTKDKRIMPDVQLVVCKVPVLAAVNTFDLDICRVAFNLNNNGRFVLVGTSPEVFANRQHVLFTTTKEATRCQSLYEWVRTLKRVFKYVRRGFRFYWNREANEHILQNLANYRSYYQDSLPCDSDQPKYREAANFLGNLFKKWNAETAYGNLPKWVLHENKCMLMNSLGEIEVEASLAPETFELAKVIMDDIPPANLNPSTGPRRKIVCIRRNVPVPILPALDFVERQDISGASS
jgi:hypothetical protein